MNQPQPVPEHSVPPAILIGCGLRDFFNADSGTAILSAYQTLDLLVPGLPPADDPDTLEFAFNRLFVGPKTLLAPPFASVYLEKDELVMGKTTLQVRELYASLGLKSPFAGTLPEDHIALEIDACLHLRQLYMQSHDQAALDLYRVFLRDHLLEWVPSFVQRMTSVNDIPAAIPAVAELLNDWFQKEFSDHH